MKKIILALSLLLFIFFLLFSKLVKKGAFDQFDFDTTVKLQDHLPRIVDYPFSLFSLLGSAEVTILILVTVAVLFLFKRFWWPLLTLPLFIVATVIEIFGKTLIYHPAPPQLLFRGMIKFDFPSHYVHTEYSYPSGHVMRTTYLITTLVTILLLRRFTLPRLTLSVSLLGVLFIMIISRVYLGEHWATDVIGGLLLGGSFGLFTGITVPSKKDSKIIDKT